MKYIYVTAMVAVIVIMTAMVTSPAKASIINDAKQGRQDGRDQARQDFPNFNDHCSNTISYCVAYESAYNKMWNNLNEVNKN